MVTEAVNTGEIQHAHLALFRSWNPEVRAFARRMILNHAAMSEQQTRLLARMGMVPIPNRLSATIEANEAAMLVDSVLPNAPLRQWVLSLPFELRGVAATKPDVLGAMERIFAEEIERLTKRLAGIAGAATGSIGFPQRFGSSLNLHVHLHTLGIDGVFDKTDDGGVCVHETPPQPSAPKDNPDADLERRERCFSASCDGFDAHCAVRLAAAATALSRALTSPALVPSAARGAPGHGPRPASRAHRS